MRTTTFLSVLLLSAYPLLAQVTFHPSVQYGIGTRPNAMIAKDFNNDGALDIATANAVSEDISVLMGQGDGTFAAAVNYPLQASARSLVSTDIDGDLDNDLIVSCLVQGGSTGVVALLLGDGAGSFTAGPVYSTVGLSVDLVLGDFDVDGVADIAVANIGGGIMIMLGSGAGTFACVDTVPASGYFRDIIAAQLDGDGHLDLATANEASNNFSVQLSNNGSFGPQTFYSSNSSPGGLACADLDSDGDLDMAVANWGANVAVFAGNGTGTFASAVYVFNGYPCHAIVACDLDNDGDLDLAAANGNPWLVTLLWGNGAMGFPTNNSYGVGNFPADLVCADLNNDGWMDIATADQLGNTVSVLLNGTTNGIDEGIASASGYCYPNPSSGMFRFSTTLGIPINEVRVLDNAGVLVVRAAGNGLSTCSLDLGQLSPGVYSAHVQDAHGVTVHRLLLQH